jgi:hypothetical protein
MMKGPGAMRFLAQQMRDSITSQEEVMMHKNDLVVGVDVGLSSSTSKSDNTRDSSSATKSDNTRNSSSATSRSSSSSSGSGYCGKNMDCAPVIEELPADVCLVFKRKMNPSRCVTRIGVAK